MSQEHEHPFYGTEILRNRQQAYIQSLLKKYRGEPVNDDLKKRIFNELQKAKTLGLILIPFKVVLRKGSSNMSADYIEVILDTKV